MIRLYDAIKEKLGDSIESSKISYQTIDEMAPGTVGIYLYTSSNDVEDLGGETVYESIKAHIEINAEDTPDGIKDALKYLRDAVDKIEKEQSTIDGVSFVMCRHVGPKALPIGKNSYDILKCVCNIDIKYILD